MPQLKQSDRKTALEQKRKHIEAQLKAIEAREKDTARKEDTRRKVIAGALALEHMEQNPESQFAKIMRELLARYVVEPRSRYLFPFLPKIDSNIEADKTADAMIVSTAIPPATSSRKTDKKSHTPALPPSDNSDLENEEYEAAEARSA